MTTACVSCGSENIACVGEIPAASFFSGRQISPVPGGNLYRCDTCHLCFRHPQLPAKVGEEMYRQGAMDNWQHDFADRYDWQNAAKWICEHVQSGAILDVGSFDGQFLSSLGPAFKKSGIEINEEASLRARSKGIEIVGSDFSALEELPAAFDVVTAFDVIEHVPDPMRFLFSLVSVTAPGGAIIVSTGNTDSLPWRLMGSRYLYCVCAEHVSFINPRWCVWAATKAGLRIERAERFCHSGRHGLLARIADLAKNSAYRLAPGAFAWLRKKGFGNVDVQKHSALALTPPTWKTARDHLLVVFRK